MFIDWIFRIQLFRKLQFTENWLIDSIFLSIQFHFVFLLSAHWMQTTKLISVFPKIVSRKDKLRCGHKGGKISPHALCFYLCASSLGWVWVRSLLCWSNSSPDLGLCALFYRMDFSSQGSTHSVLNSISFHLWMHLLTYVFTNSLQTLYCSWNPGPPHSLGACGYVAGIHWILVKSRTGITLFCLSHTKASTRKATVDVSEHFNSFSAMKVMVGRWGTTV